MAPAGPIASGVFAALCAAAYRLARPARAASPSEAARRAAFAFALLGCFAGGASLAAGVAYRGPTIVLTVLGVYAANLPFYGFMAYLLGALLVGPLAREGHRLVRRRGHDGWQRLVTTAALVGTIAVLPSLAGASADEDLAAISALAFAGTWLACLWVVASHAYERRLLTRIRAGRLAGYRLRGPTAAERRTLASVFSEYGDDQPMETLVRLADVPSGAYREAPIEEPLALVPALDARPTRMTPALVAVLVPMAQAMVLLVMWSVV